MVLVNSRCPFGAEVQHSPLLCRMTSAERSALGDPGCRMIIHLGTAVKPPSEPTTTPRRTDAASAHAWGFCWCYLGFITCSWIGSGRAVRTSASATDNDAMATMTQLAVVVAVTIVVMLVITYPRR